MALVPDAETQSMGHLLQQEEEAAHQGRDAGHQEDSERLESLYEKTDPILLGEGTYGKVYKARHKRTGRIVAMKKMPLDWDDEGLPSTYLREIALLKTLNHRHVVELLDVFCNMQQPNAKVVLIFEYLENDLKKFMRARKNRLSADVIRKLASQLCLGIEHCHAKSVLHRDLKPQNLLIDDRSHLKLADFGLARDYHPVVKKYTQEVVTVWYRAPELLMGSAMYSAPIDMWSVGSIIAEMAVGAPLFNGDSEIDTVFKIFRLLGTPSEDAWPGVGTLPHFKPSFPKFPHASWAARFETPGPTCWKPVVQSLQMIGVDLVASLLLFDPRRRLSARHAVRHAFFADSTPPMAAMPPPITPPREAELALLDLETPEKLAPESPKATPEKLEPESPEVIIEFRVAPDGLKETPAALSAELLLARGAARKTGAPDLPQVDQGPRKRMRTKTSLPATGPTAQPMSQEYATRSARNHDAPSIRIVTEEGQSCTSTTATAEIRAVW